jgi:uncharacterized membrane protein
MNPVSRRPLTTAGIVLGLGLGGFFDGIVLHQLLQWHHVVSVPLPPNSMENLQANTLADGLFHALTWILVAAGLALLWRAARQGATRFGGGALLAAVVLGWGIFNVVEGLLNHHLLNLHHVREGVPDVALWDLLFLIWGALMIAGGWLALRARPAVGPA